MNYIKTSIRIFCADEVIYQKQIRIQDLNAVLGGFTYQKDPPSITLKSKGKLITVRAKKFAG